MKTYYGSLCSWFYDIDKPFAPKKELDFYLSYAREGMSVLEPMCGSGRFLVEFVKRGFNIDGFDISSEMINRCKTKIEGIGNGAEIVCCDFSTYHTEKLYDCIYIAAYSFSLFTEDIEIRLILAKLRDLIKPGGKILLGVLTDLDFRNNDMEDGVWKDDNPRIVKEDDVEIILRSTTCYDRFKSATISRMTYELYEKGVFIKHEDEDFYIKRYRDGEFEKLVTETGLVIENTCIDFEKSEHHVEDTGAMVYVLTK